MKCVPLGKSSMGYKREPSKSVNCTSLKDTRLRWKMIFSCLKLMRSIEDKGVLVPLIVRSNPYGEGYEIIAGHREKQRVRGQELRKCL